ncbi:MAG: hypothetical protein CVV07_08935 [Gammaproteobacteria bacterium HGW-Gammaproteobacteria-11]|nr:MAG: hypothetical protein CVV07_08935 [Gammaproteobacteria bacterium HGW-Gammaproteobacteria-11]
MRQLLCLLGLSLILLCGHATADERKLVVELAGERMLLERVADPESRRQGLMGRAKLADDEGMLFDFPPGTRPAIWMRNMVIALDLVYLDGQARITHIFSNVPPCETMPCQVYQADRSLRFVLELAAGSVQRLNLEVGQQLDLGAAMDFPQPRL